MSQYFGELIGLLAAFLWAFSAMAWSLSGRRVGSVAVTAIRILLAAVILVLVHWAIYGHPWPSNMHKESLTLLAISGILGAGAGDLCLFKGLLILGPRLGLLILSLSPVLAALMAYCTPMHQTLTVWSLTGILLTVVGIAWVVSDGAGRQAWRTPPEHFLRGVVITLIGTTFIAAGYVTSNWGMKAGPADFFAGQIKTAVAPFSAGMVRVVAATAFIWMVLPFMRCLGSTVKAFADRKSLLIIIGGTIVGPVIGIWLSMIALQGQSTGVASAMLSTAPLMMIPIAFFVYGDKPNARTLVGTAIAIGGIILMTLTSSHAN